jgi:hypothetical protein
MSAEDRLMYGEGELSFIDDDGTVVRIGRVPEEVIKILARHGQKPVPMAYLDDDGIIHYLDGRTKNIADEMAPPEEPPDGAQESRD